MNIAHYKLLEQIGAGGLGDVYRARDTKVGRTVALKVSEAQEAAGDGARRGALLARARDLLKLSHPSIATLFDAGEEGGRAYLAFEFVQGRPLRAVIGNHPLNPRRAVAFGIQLADALAVAHAEELVHGDIRPETIAVTDKERAKLLDFGLSAFTRGGAARTAGPAAASDERRRAVAPYLAPEEAEGAGPSEASDIFALGCVLFEMLTGRQAVGADRGKPAPPPSTFAGSVPAELEAIVTRATAVDPARRYLSAATLAAELRGVGAILDVRAAEQEAMFDEDAPSFLRRVLPWLLALAALGAAAGGLWIW